MVLLYYMMDAKNDANADESLRLLLALFDEESNEFTSVSDVLADSTKFDGLVYKGFDVKYVKLSDYPNPFITLGNETPADVSTTKINSVYSSVIKQLNGAKRLSPEIEAKFCSLLVGQGVSDRMAKLVILCCYALNEMLSKDLNIIPTFGSDKIAPAFAQQTQSWLNEMNRRNTMANIKDNETKFQPSCTSELFIKLPSYEAMVAYLSSDEDESEQQEIKDMNTFMPARAEVSDPYGINTFKYEDPESVETMLREYDREPSKVSEIALKEIMGNPDCNTDEIFDNEKRFYDSLNEWLGIISTEYDGQDNGELCAISLEYMRALASTLYIWYWQHNPRVPCNIDVQSGQDVDESKYSFRTDTHLGSAPEDLIAFLDRVAADLGREAYVKAIIQLARWGSRKQTEIVFDGYDKCFDLGTGAVLDALPSLSSYDKVMSNGCEYKLTQLIESTTDIADQRIGFRRWPMPIGVTLQQTYQDKSSGNVLKLDTYFSMIDLVREIVLGHITVDGISYNGETWEVADVTDTITSDAVNNSIKMPDKLQFPIFRGTGLIQIYSDLHIANPSNTDTHFSIMGSKLMSSRLLSFIDDNTFDTYSKFDELTALGKPNRKQATDYMIVRDLLKVFHAAATMYTDGMSNSELISTWHKAILESGYVDEAYFYKGVTKPSEPLPGCKVENFNKCFWHKGDENVSSTGAPVIDYNVPESASVEPQKMPIGTTVQENSTPHVSVKPEADFVSAVLMQPAANCRYCGFVDKSGNVPCVAAINPRTKLGRNGEKRPDPIFVILDERTRSTLDESQITNSQPLERLLTHMCKAFFTMAKNQPVDSNLRFCSSDAIKELHAYFRDR